MKQQPEQPKFGNYTRLYEPAYRDDFWVRDSPIPTPIGSYTVELVVSRNSVPDQGMLAAAEEAIEYLKDASQQIAEILPAHARWCADKWGEDQVYLFDSGGEIPEDLIPEDVVRKHSTGAMLFHIYGGGRIAVHKHIDHENELEVLVGFNIPYDEEHGLTLEFKDGRFTKLNDSEFKIIDGRLIFDWEEDFTQE